MPLCATPGCTFRAHSQPQRGFDGYCCIACAEGGSHGPRCERILAATAGPASGGLPDLADVEPIDVFEDVTSRLESSRLSGDREEEAAALLLTAELQLAREQKEAALESAGAARDVYKELGDDGKEAEAVRLAVKALLVAGRLREASTRERKEREAFEKGGKRVGAALMLLSCSDTNLAAGDPRKALKAATTAAAAFKRLGDVRGQAMALHQVGEVQKEFNGADEMLDVVRKAAPLLKELGDDKEEARMMEIKSHAYQVKGDPVKAMEATEAGLALSRSAGDRMGEGAALNNIANVHLMMPDGAADALEAAHEAFVHCAATGNKREAAFALGEMVNAYCMLERVESAFQAQKKLLDLARERGDRQQIQAAQEGLAYLQSAR